MVDSVDKTQIHSEWGELRQKLLLPPDFDTKIPLTKTKMLASTNAPAALLGSFLEPGAEINILRSVGSSLRCVSSGINSYVSFRTLLRKPIPPTDDTVLSWRATFAHGKTFRNYVGHLKRGRILAGHPLEWNSSAAKAAAAGLIKAKRGTFQFPNFISHQDMFKIINFLRWGRVFSQLIFISYLFAQRAPQRHSTSEGLLPKTPLPNLRTDPLRPLSGLEGWETPISW